MKIFRKLIVALAICGCLTGCTGTKTVCSLYFSVNEEGTKYYATTQNEYGENKDYEVSKEAYERYEVGDEFHW